MAIRTALVVDDSRLARLTLTKLLEKRDIRVTQASSAREAMESLAGGRPDVIMMDVTMPDTDGFEATRQITGNPDTSTIPVVMCTAEDTNEARDQAHACGAHGFLTKPASEENITDVLQRLAEQLEASEPTLLDEPPATRLPDDASPQHSVDASEIDARARVAAETVLREQGGALFTGLMNDVARKVFESMVPANDSQHDVPLPDDFIEQVRAQAVESATAAASDVARQVAREEADAAARSFVESSGTEAEQNASTKLAELRTEVDKRIDGLLDSGDFNDRIEQAIRAALEESGLSRREIVAEARQEVAEVVQRETAEIAANIQEGMDPSDIDAVRIEARKALDTAKQALVVSFVVLVAAVGIALAL